MSAIDKAQKTDLTEADRSSPALMLALLGADAMRRLRTAHAAQGLEPRQFQILALLHDRGAIPQSALATEFDIAPSVVVGLLNPLEKAGYISRERDAHDRRRHLVRLTTTGRTCLRGALRAQHAVENDIFGALDGSQRDQLTALLAVVRDARTGGDPHCATTASLENFS